MKLFIKNKRNFLRIKAYHLLKYKILKDDQQEKLSSAKDLGAGGILFQSSKDIPKGEELKLIINLPPYPKPIKVVAKVLRSKYLKRKGTFEVAAKFINIEEEAELFIQERIAMAGARQQEAKLKKIIFFLIIVFGVVILSIFLVPVLKGKGWL